MQQRYLIFCSVEGTVVGFWKYQLDWSCIYSLRTFCKFTKKGKSLTLHNFIKPTKF